MLQQTMTIFNWILLPQIKDDKISSIGEVTLRRTESNLIKVLFGGSDRFQDTINTQMQYSWDQFQGEAFPLIRV